VRHRKAHRLTRVEKANGFDIYKVQFLQIQNCRRFAKLDFGFNLIQLFRAKVSAKPNPQPGPFNLERHEVAAPEYMNADAMQGPLRIH
jgi:hypothetical protein